MKPDTTIILEHGGNRGMEVAFYSTATGEKERVSDAYLFKQYKELTEEVQRLRGQTQEEPNVR